MSKHRRSFSREFKISIIRELESGTSVAQLSRTHQLHGNLIRRWQREYRTDPEHAFSGNGKAQRPSARLAELERTIGQLYLENAFLKKTLKHLESTLSQYRKEEL